MNIQFSWEFDFRCFNGTTRTYNINTEVKEQSRRATVSQMNDLFIYYTFS